MFGTLMAVVAIFVAVAALWAVTDGGRKMQEHNKVYIKNHMSLMVRQMSALKDANEDLTKRLIQVEAKAAAAEGIRQEFTRSNAQLTEALKALHREITIIEKAIPPRKLEALREDAAKRQRNRPESVS